MKLKSTCLTLFSLLTFAMAQAQVKVGANPGSLTTGAVLDAEGSSGARTVIMNDGRVGVNTTNPNTSADLELGSGNKALYLNRVSSTSAITAPQPGMVIYDLSVGCVKSYQGNPAAWSDCLSGSVANVTSLSCSSAAFNPTTATRNQNYTGTLTIPYNGGNGGPYTSETFTLNGLTFTRNAGTVNRGDGQIVYTISGTPTTSGSTTVNISFAGQSCSGLTLPVNGFALTCGSTFNPSSATQSAAYTGQLTVPYTGGDGSSYAAQNFTVDGLTFSLSSGNFSSGSGNLVYTISGTANSTSGSTTANYTINGSSCTSVLPVNSSNGGTVVPGSATLGTNLTHWVASIFDNNYLPYTAPTVAATTARPVDPDVTLESKLIDYQGLIPASGIVFRIPYNTSGTGSLKAWKNSFVVPGNLAEDGVSRTLQFSWEAQSVTGTTTYIMATIKSLGGDFKAKKLDINAGIGNDYLGVLLGSFQYPYNNAGTMTTYTVRDIPGIPDRMFGKADNAGDANTHLMLYLPMIAEDGNTYLNNNLGADYSNLMKPMFSITQQATFMGDQRGYGSKFQFGRKPDGHELMVYNYDNTANTSSVYPDDAVTNPQNVSSVSTPRFLVKGWTTNSNLEYLWRNSNKGGANNPCPVGFMVPSSVQWNMLGSAVANNPDPADGNFVKKSVLRLQSVAFRDAGIYGVWTSTASSNVGFANIGTIDSSGGISSNSSTDPALGATLRCIKE